MTRDERCIEPLGRGPVPLLEGLSDQEASLVTSSLRLRHFRAGSVLLAAGERPQALYLLEAGTADVLAVDRDGRRHRLNRLGPGETIGEMSLLTGQPASATVRATSPVEVLSLSADSFERLGETCPRLGRNLATIVSQRLARSTRRTLHTSSAVVTLLWDRGAPSLLAYALAASLAWHTRAPTAVLVLDDDPPAELDELACVRIRADGELAGASCGSRPPGAAALFLAPAAHTLGPSALGRLQHELAARHDHLLVWSRAADLDGFDGARRLELRASGTSGGATIRGARGWAEGRPDGAVISLPPLQRADRARLAAGALPPGTPAGRVLGALARDVARLRIGLALGAGSLRGYAHVGVLRVLERHGLAADCLAGASVGAGVAGMVALGRGSGDVEALLDEAAGHVFRLGLPTRSLVSSQALAKMLRRLAGRGRIEDLPVPLGVVAADILQGREVVFRSGLLWRAVLASGAMPGVYPAQRIGPHVLVDGGIVNPVPGSVVAEMGADVVIGVRLGDGAPALLNDVEAVDAGGRVPSVLTVLGRTLRVMQHRISLDVASTATVLIEPGLDPRARPRSAGGELRRFTQGRRYIELGEAAAEAALPQLTATVPWLRA